MISAAPGSVRPVSLDDAAVNFRRADFEDHLLAFTLRHERETEGFAGGAGALFRVGSGDAPKVVARFKAG